MLAALAVALFAVMQSTRADEHPHVAITINDSDNVVDAGTYIISLEVMNDDATANDTLSYLRIAESTTDVLLTAANPTLSAPGNLVVREGASGEYTILVGVAEAADSSDIIEGELTIDVDEVGVDVGSAAITFGYTNAAGTDISVLATETGRKLDTDTAEAGATGAGDDNIYLILTVNNGLGNKTNDGDVNNITIIAQGGRLSAATADFTSATGIPFADQSGSVTHTTAGAETRFSVSAEDAGEVKVWAIVVGTDGSNESSDPVTLKFSGTATAIALGDVSGSLDDGDETTGVYFDVTGTDSSGADSALASGAVGTPTVTKFPDGAAAADLTITAVDGTAADTTAALGAIRVTAVVASGATPTPGDYTITVQLGADASTAKTAIVTVVGEPETVELSSDMTHNVSFGDTVTVTATVKDENGNLVANSDTASSATDGVTFTWASKALTAESLNGNGVTSGNRPIAKGQATASFVVTGDEGSAVVIATAEGNKRATITISTGAAPDPEPEVDETAPEPEAEPATLASVSAGLADKYANYGDTVGVGVTVTDSEGNTAADELIAAVILKAGDQIVIGDATGEQTIDITCNTVGDLNISVTVTGTDRESYTGENRVVCLGPVTAITLGDPSGNLSQIGDDSVTIEVTGATDSAGNSVDVPSDLEASVSGEGVSASVEGSTVTVSSSGTAAAKVAAGDYTVTVSSGDVSAEATVTVDAETGPPASIAISASSDEVSSGDLLTVTATVTDSGGDAVADGTVVAFTAGGSVTLTAISTTVTADGDATATYIVGSGEGSATIYAVSGAASDSVTVSTPAPVVEEEEPREPSLGDFSRLTGLASYNGPDASASDLLALLAGRATAIWLSSGDGWVLYAMSDGGRVPGSMDFTATAGDVVYISN